MNCGALGENASDDKRSVSLFLSRTYVTFKQRAGRVIARAIFEVGNISRRGAVNNEQSCFRVLCRTPWN